MNVLLIGPQGSGKGAQAELLLQQYGSLNPRFNSFGEPVTGLPSFKKKQKTSFAYFESGKQLRQIAQSSTKLGLEVKEILESGSLITDIHMYFLLKDWLERVSKDAHILLDGYPRRLSQIRDVEKLFADRDQKVDLVFFLTISDGVAIQRLLGRLLCQANEHVYNSFTKPPKALGVCDIDGSPLVIRRDETQEAIKKRLDIFHRETEPLIEYLRKKGIVEEINGDRPIEVVFQDLVNRLSRRFPLFK